MMPADTSRRRLVAAAGAAALGWAVPAARAGPYANDIGQIVAIAALREQAVLLKAGGHALSRSDDSGRTWREVPLALPRAAVIGSLAVSAGPASVIYAAGPRVGVLRVNEHRALSRGLPRDITAVTAHARQAGTV